MPELKINIVRFVEDSQPGIVAAEFEDADGIVHTIIDKVPIFSRLELGADSSYPQAGTVRCKVMQIFADQTGRDLAQISLDFPDQVESTAGLSEFVVMTSALT